MIEKMIKRKYPWISIPKKWRRIIQTLKEYRPRLHYHIVKWERPRQGEIKCNTYGVSGAILGVVPTVFACEMRGEK